MSAESYLATGEVAETAQAFLETFDEWKVNSEDATAALRQLCSEANADALGYMSKDPLNMSVFGVVFDGDPGPGWMHTVSEMTHFAQAQGAEGICYIPDTSVPLGQKVQHVMDAVSAAQCSRPMLFAPGVRPAALDKNDNLIFTAVKITDGVVYVVGDPSRITPSASLRPVSTYERPTMRPANA